jgi:hypothetical protein
VDDEWKGRVFSLACDKLPAAEPGDVESLKDQARNCDRSRCDGLASRPFLMTQAESVKFL